MVWSYDDCIAICFVSIVFPFNNLNYEKHAETEKVSLRVEGEK